jgi:uncharacterized protein (TIGR00299 family) protein
VILLFDIHTGVAGDMILAALFDLGLDFSAWRERMAALELPGLVMEIRKVNKHGLAATKFDVTLPPERGHRGLPEIRRIIGESALSDGVKERSVRIFSRLAEVEAEIHGRPVDQVHFHELGALDAIVDIVGACVGFEMLGVTDFLATPLTFGSGTVQTAHGRMTVPVPATLALSRGFPSVRTGLPGELCTPTGAAVVTTLSRPVPTQWAGVLDRHGYGAGTRDLPDRANVLRLCLMRSGDVNPGKKSGAFEEPGGAAASGLHQVECNLDNMAPELIAYAAERLFAAGCRDVWQEPIVMKKNRSAVKLCALAEPADLERALAVLAEETSTGGMRWFPVNRLVAAKGAGTAETAYGAVALKQVTFPGKPARYTPEFESCRQLALAAGVPLQEVYRAALAASARASGDAVPPLSHGKGGAAPSRTTRASTSKSKKAFPIACAAS